jgi:hypothetical protein
VNTLAPEIPATLQHRPLWNGFVIPFSTYVTPEGKPDFKVTDQEAWIRCARYRLCGICGQKLFAEMFFIGGEASMESGLFFDPPMHEACARYSFSVCPFLSGKKGYANLQNMEGIADLHVDTNMPTEKPKRMGLLRCSGYQLVNANGSIYFLGTKLGVEWFDNAQHIGSHHGH